jgi:hypothetical protein
LEYLPALCASIFTSQRGHEYLADASRASERAHKKKNQLPNAFRVTPANDLYIPSRVEKFLLKVSILTRGLCLFHLPAVCLTSFVAHFETSMFHRTCRCVVDLNHQIKPEIEFFEKN